MPKWVEIMQRYAMAAVAAVLGLAGEASAVLPPGVTVTTNGTKGDVLVTAVDPASVWARIVNANDEIVTINDIQIATAAKFTEVAKSAATTAVILVFEPDFKQFVEFTLETSQDARGKTVVKKLTKRKVAAPARRAK